MTTFDDAGARKASIDAIERRLAELHLLNTRVEAAMADAVADLQGHNVPLGDGCRTTAEWLAWKLNVSIESGRRLARLGTIVQDAPAIAEALDAARISVDQARPIAAIAKHRQQHPTSVIDELGDLPVANLELIARKARPPRPPAEKSTASMRAGQSGELRLHAELLDDDGATVAAALRRGADRIRRELAGAHSPVEMPTLEQRQAQALVELCRHAIASDADPDRATVVVHVPASAVIGGRPIVDIDGIDQPDFDRGSPLSQHVLDRISCDCRMQVVLDDEGRIIGISEMQRTPSPAMIRALRRRDRRCRFPGCAAHGFLQAHHAIHDEHGGPTATTNLLMLCPWHHKLCHEGGWRVDMDADGRGGATFHRPDGTIHAHTDPPAAAA